MKKLMMLAAPLFFSTSAFAQADLVNSLKVGELVLGGLSFFKSSKASAKKDSKFVESVCVKNKLSEKITFKIAGKDDQDNDVKKELVIPNDGKECFYTIPKGIYTYEVDLSNKDIYKKGEYKFDDDVVITIKKDD